MKSIQKWIINDFLEESPSFSNNEFDLILADPPYGIGESSNRNFSRSKIAKAKDYGKKSWDDKRLDKSYFDEMLRISKNQIIFGGNYYIDYLKPTSCFIVWDKENGKNDFADCELAWTSFNKATRLFKYRWSGMLQGDMKNKETRIHPTQKPLPLYEWILKKYTKSTDRICDPFCGSGTTLEACARLNLNCLCIDNDNEWENYYQQRINKGKLHHRSNNPKKITDFFKGKE